MNPARKLVLFLVLLLIAEGASALVLGAITGSQPNFGIWISIYIVGAFLLVYDYRARRRKRN